MDDLLLIYINLVGKDYKDNYIYEFIFSDTIVDVDGESWDTFPASGRPEPPHNRFIKSVGRLESEVIIDVIQNSDTFAVWDAVDGVIALGWENVNEYETYPEYRLIFKFGESMKKVNTMLYEKDLILDYKNNKNKDE
jgi:hypothetical protein